MENTFAEAEFYDLYDDDEFNFDDSLLSYDDENESVDLCIYGCGNEATFTYGPCDRRYCQLSWSLDHPESLLTQEA